MQEKRDMILDEALKSVPFDGWSDAVLRQSAVNAGLDENYAPITFKAGPIDAISLFLNKDLSICSTHAARYSVFLLMHC